MAGVPAGFDPTPGGDGIQPHYDPGADIALGNAFIAAGDMLTTCLNTMTAALETLT
jgi:hypothetical protein